MIKDVEKILNASATGLKYRKKETMQGLYFKEMLARTTNSKNNDSANTYENKQKIEKKEEKKINTISNDVNQNNIEGTLLDKFC